MNDLLHGILKAIVRLPWLHADAGGIFLADPAHRRLELAAHLNFTPQIQEACARVAYGHCLCGRVAQSGELLHASNVDHRHEVCYQGRADHGHYVVPIRDGDELLGVLTLYVAAGHRYREDEVEVLRDFATILALIIRQGQLQRDKALAELVVEHSSHGVMITDRERRILWVNRAFEKTTGYSLKDVKGKTPRVISSGRHGPEFYQRMWRCIEQQGQWQGEIWNRRKNGEVYPEWLNIVAFRNDSGMAERYAGIFVDLTEIRRAEEHIFRLAYYDGLTGLPNRAHFSQQLTQWLSPEGPEPKRVAVIVLDLDHFHEVNAALGREAGDALLREAAGRLRDIGKEWLVARGELDQFLVALPIGEAEAHTLLDRAGNAAEAIREILADPLEHAEQKLTLNVTIGVADSRLDDTAEALLGRAMLALRRAKQERRGSIRFFDDKLGEEAERDHYILLNVRDAWCRGELFLVYQPQLDQAGGISGAEALLRWNSPRLGVVSPDLFIRHAEERGAIGDIGRWVFSHAAQQLEQWLRSGLVGEQDFTMAINLSPAQLLGSDVVQDFAATTAELGLAPWMFELEVTESAFMQSSDSVKAQLDALSSHGFRIAIDDFGTGHSSLARLNSFPIDTFKIDRSFIEKVAEGGKHLALVKSMIAMAHELGQSVVAEGVEDDRQFAILRNLGCESFQGYWFSKPLAVADFERYLRKGMIR